MSLDERDYVYDPKEFRKNSQNQPTWGLFFLRVFIWTIIGGGLFLAFKSYQDQHQGKGQLKFGVDPALGLLCEPLPPNGNINVLEPSVVRRSDVMYSGFRFQSELAKPVVLLISNPDRNVPYQAVAVHPKQLAEVNLPIGAYGVTVLAGDRWCNVKDGFVNGTRTFVNPAVEVKAGATGNMLMQPENAGQFNLSVSYQSLADQMAEKLPQQVFGSGFMELRRGKGGRYNVLGRVNSTQVEFAIDTGASITSVSQQVGWSAGIPQCTPREFATANGKVTGCVGIAKQLVFGNFTMNDVEVAIMPQMDSIGLLGMNVLSRLRIEQQADVMRLSVQ